MPHQPLFAGLVVDEFDRRVDTALLVGDEPYYIVDDAGFRRHIPAEQIDRVVLGEIASLMKGSEDLDQHPAGQHAALFCGLGIGRHGARTHDASLPSLISKAVPQHLRGTAFGLFSTSLGVISLPAPWIGAQLWDRVSPQFPFTTTAIALFLSIIPIWLKFKLPKSEEPAAEVEPNKEESAVAAA